MTTWQNPDIKLEWYDGTWHDVFAKCKELNWSDGGILKPPKLTALMRNTDGYFTTGSTEIPVNSPVRLRIDVGNGLKRAFYGEYKRYDGDRQQAEEDYVSLIIDSKAGKLDEDYVGKNYRGYTYEEMIQDILQNPASGHTTGIALTSYPDWSDASIYDLVSDEFDFKNSPATIKSVLEKVAETIEYDGYISYVKGTDWELHFWPVGTVETSPKLLIASKADGGYLSNAQPVMQIHDLKNYIIVKGQTDLGYPPTDTWTEEGVAKYDPVAWTGYNEGDIYTVVDDFDTTRSGISVNVLRCKHQKSGYGLTKIGAELDIAKTGYKRPADDAPRLSFNDERFKAITFWFRSPNRDCYLAVRLIDDAGKEAFRQTDTGIGTDWFETTTTFNVEPDNHGDWTVDSGFDWGEIAKIRIYGANAASPFQYDEVVYIDALRIAAIERVISPISYPSIYPVAKDDTSISDYGLKVYLEQDDKVHSKERHQAKQDRLLAMMNRKYKTVDARLYRYIEDIRATQTVDVGLPNYGIGGQMWEDDVWEEDVWQGVLVWRLDEAEHEWSRDTKLLRTIVHLVEEFVFLPTYMKAKQSQQALMAQFIEKPR